MDILSKNMGDLFKSLAIKAINNNGYKVGAIRLHQYIDITKLKFAIEYKVMTDNGERLDSHPFEITFRTGGLFRMLNDDGYNSIFTSLNTQTEALNINTTIIEAYKNQQINFMIGIQ